MTDKNITIPEPIKPGIYTNTELSNEDYHADRDYISSTGLKLLPNKLGEYIARYRMKQKAESKSEALKFGGGMHSAILEPDIFPTEYVIEPLVNKRTNDGKAELKEFYASCEAKGKTILTPQDMDTIKAMRNTVMQHPTAGPALNMAIPEQSFFLAGEINEKVRLDAFKSNVIMDVKSCESIDKFFNAAAQYSYNVSEAMYRNVASEIIGEPVEFLFIAVQKTYPFTAEVFQSDDLMRSEGDRKYREAKDAYLELRESNNWGEIRSLSLPNWEKPESEQF